MYQSPQHMINGRPLFGPHSRHLFELLNDAVPKFHKNVGDHTASKMTFTRVLAMPTDKRTRDKWLRAMRRQAEVPSEIEGWLNIPLGSKMLFCGKYNHPNGRQVKTSDAVPDDIYIDPALNMTLAQLRQWWSHNQRAKCVTCECKLLVDTLLAKGERLYISPPTQIGRYGRVVSVERHEITPPYSFNAFLVVDECDRNYHSRTNDAASPNNWQEARDDGFLAHDILNFKIEMSDGSVHSFLMDAAYRMVMASLDCPEHLHIYPLSGPGLDRPYVNPLLQRQLCRALVDEEPFSVRDMRLYLDRCEPNYTPFESMYRTQNVVLGVLDVIASYTGIHIYDEAFGGIRADAPSPPPSPGVSPEEQARRDAYDRNLIADMRAEKEKMDARRSRANASRAARAAKGEAPYTVTIPQVGKATERRRQRTALEDAVHDVHTNPEQKALRSAAFKARESDIMAEAATRRARARTARDRDLQVDSGKRAAASRHRVPDKPTVNGALAVAMQAVDMS